MMAQGVSIGYVLSSVLEAFVADYILQQAPQVYIWIHISIGFSSHSMNEFLHATCAVLFSR